MPLDSRHFYTVMRIVRLNIPIYADAYVTDPIIDTNSFVIHFSFQQLIFNNYFFCC